LQYIDKESKKADNKDILTLLNEQQNIDINIQETFFKEYIDKAISSSEELNDAVLVGLRV
jgi:hypothetical protein